MRSGYSMLVKFLTCLSILFFYANCGQADPAGKQKVVEIQGDQAITDHVVWDGSRMSYHIHGGVSVKEGGRLDIAVTGENSTFDIDGELKVEKGGEVRIGHTSKDIKKRLQKFWRKSTDTKSKTEVHVKGTITIAGKLLLTDATLGQKNEYQVQYYYQFHGGTLITRDNAFIGGMEVGGKQILTYFDLSDGEWICTNTTLQYSGGIGVSDKGKLKANHIIQGNIPDSVAMNGNGGEVEIKNSTFNILFTADFRKGGTVKLNLPVNKRMAYWDSTSLNQGEVRVADYSAKLINVTVPFWWLSTVVASKGDAPEAKIILEDVKEFGMHLTGNNLRNADENDFKLPVRWQKDNIFSKNGFTGKHPWEGDIPAGTKWRTGNLQWEVGSHSTGLDHWGVYPSGAETDLILRGPTAIAELTFSEGKVSVQGTPGTHDAVVWGLTFNVGDENVPESGPAILEMKNIALGLFDSQFVSFPGSFIVNNASMTFENARLGIAELRTIGNGTITGKRSCLVPLKMDNSKPYYEEFPAGEGSIQVEGADKHCK